MRSRQRFVVILRSLALEKQGDLAVDAVDASLLRALAAAGSSIICAAPLIDDSHPLRGSRVKQTQKLEGARFLPLPYPVGPNRTTVSRIKGTVGSWRALWKSLGHADGVLVFLPSPLGLLGLMAARLRGCPTVSYVGGDWRADPSHFAGRQPTLMMTVGMLLRGLLQLLTFRLSTRLLVRDPRLLARMPSHRASKAPPLSLFTTEDAYTRSLPVTEPYVCLSVCRLKPVKGLPDMLRAIQILRRRGMDVVLWHAGEGEESYKSEVKDLASRLQISSRVVHYGYLDKEGLANLYRQADVFVLASRSEGLPRSLWEAMLYSLPCVTTNVGGVASLVREQGRVALLVEPGDPTALADALELVLTNRDVRRDLITTGHRWAIDTEGADDAARAIREELTGLSSG